MRQVVPERVVKIGRKWLVLTHDGTRALGEHDTKHTADAQKTAISISRARHAGYRIPRRKKG